MDTDELLQVSADAFHRLNGRPSLNSDIRLWRFWRDVALRLGQLEYRRAMSARRVAQYARYIAHHAEGREEALRNEIARYRAQIEALKAR